MYGPRSLLSHPPQHDYGLRGLGLFDGGVTAVSTWTWKEWAVAVGAVVVVGKVLR